MMVDRISSASLNPPHPDASASRIFLHIKLCSLRYSFFEPSSEQNTDIHDIQAKNEQWIILDFLKRKFVEFCDRIYAFINGLFPKMNSRLIIDILDLSSLASMIHLDNVMQYL